MKKIDILTVLFNTLKERKLPCIKLPVVEDTGLFPDQKRKLLGMLKVSLFTDKDYEQNWWEEEMLRREKNRKLNEEDQKEEE